MTRQSPADRYEDALRQRLGIMSASGSDVRNTNTHVPDVGGPGDPSPAWPTALANALTQHERW